MKMKIMAVCCAVLWLSSACVPKSAAPDRPMPTAYVPQTVPEGDLTRHQVLVVGAVTLLRGGVALEGGMVTLAPDAPVSFINPAEGMKELSNSVSTVRTLDDGTEVMDILHLYGDDLGRIQGVMDQVGYVVSRLSPEERQAVADGLIEDGRAVMASGNAEMINYHTQKVQAFQAQAGLAVDGDLGLNTARAMADAMGKVEIKGVQSVPVYSDEPRFEVYVVKESVFRNAVSGGGVAEGFAGIDAVRRIAITPLGDLRKVAAGSSSFVALVYFMDQVPKGTALQVAFSGSSNRKDTDRKATMNKVYAVGRDWPVLVAPVAFKTLPSQLYLHVLMDGRIVDTTKL